MIDLPLQINKIEILSSDPEIKKPGLIWFNKSENVIKFYDGDFVAILLTNNSFKDEISDLVDEKIEKTFFKFKFDDSKMIKIKHDFDTRLFYISVFDEKENSIISATANIIDENNIEIEFVENISGYILINFYQE
jgi:hypothetical protein